MKNKQLNQILILVVLLIIIGISNYYNYYKLNYKHWPTKPEYSFEQLSPEDQTKMLEANRKLASGGVIPEKDERRAEKKQIADGSNNYLVYAVDSSGNLVRWNKSTIKVYVSNNPYRDAMYDALSEYNKVFDGFINFVLAPANNADIIIEVVDKFDSNDISHENYMAGNTNNVFSDKNELSSSRIRLLSVKPNTKRKVSNYEIYTVLMHELGHALGIIGHSPNEKDIMYAFSTNSKGVLTHRDINTIKIMYSNNDEIIQRETAGYASKKIKEAQKYVKATPQKALSWVILGKTYYDNGRKNEALDAYKKALTLEPKNPDIYQSMAECYYNSEKYDTAIKYYRFAIENSNSTQTLAQLNNMIGMSYIKKNDDVSAYKYFQHAFGYAPNNKMYLRNLITVCVGLDKKQEAINYINSYKATGADITNDEIIQKALKWAQVR